MRTFAIILVAAVITQPALADDWVPPVTDPTVQKECGSCHMAFAPAFLPARSWAVMMDHLSNHFGEQLVIPAEKAQTIRVYLSRNAGDTSGHGKLMRGIAADAAPQQITATPAFLRKHRFPDKVWADPKIVTKSNCAACHRDAERGNFDDD